jgi:hypothetical protein
MQFLLKFMIFVTTDSTRRAGQTSPVVYVSEVQLQLMPDLEREQPLLCLLTRGNYKVEDERVQSGGLRTQQVRVKADRRYLEK